MMASAATADSLVVESIFLGFPFLSRMSAPVEMLPELSLAMHQR